MPVLHFRITSATQVINVNRELHAQNFTLKRVIAVKDTSARPAAPAAQYNGGLTLDFDFLQGNQVMSNIAPNDVIFAIPEDSTGVSSSAISERYDLNFDSEDIRTQFTVKVFNFDKSAPAPFAASYAAAKTTGQGELAYVDVFIEFQELHNGAQYLTH